MSGMVKCTCGGNAEPGPLGLVTCEACDRVAILNDDGEPNIGTQSQVELADRFAKALAEGVSEELYGEYFDEYWDKKDRNLAMWAREMFEQVYRVVGGYGFVQRNGLSNLEEALEVLQSAYLWDEKEEEEEESEV